MADTADYTTMAAIATAISGLTKAIEVGISKIQSKLVEKDAQLVEDRRKTQMDQIQSSVTVLGLEVKRLGEDILALKESTNTVTQEMNRMRVDDVQITAQIGGLDARVADQILKMERMEDRAEQQNEHIRQALNEAQKALNDLALSVARAEGGRNG